MKKVLPIITWILLALAILAVCFPFLYAEINEQLRGADDSKPLEEGLRLVVLILLCLPAGGILALVSAILSLITLLRRPKGRARISPAISLSLSALIVLPLLAAMIVGAFT